MKDRAGIYIVIEGLDRMGKTTIKELLYNYIKKLGFEINCAYSDRIAGNRVPSMIGNYPDEIAYMFYWQAIRFSELTQILPVLNSGGVVLGDRNFITNLTYNLWTDLDFDFMLAMEKFYYPLCIKPDLTIILHAPYELFQSRDDGDTRLSHEEFDSIVSNYRIWSNRLVSDGYDVCWIDSSGPPEETFIKILEKVLLLFELCTDEEKTIPK